MVHTEGLPRTMDSINSVRGYVFERENSVLLEVLHQETSSLERSTVLPPA